MNCVYVCVWMFVYGCVCVSVCMYVYGCVYVCVFLQCPPPSPCAGGRGVVAVGGSVTLSCSVAGGYPTPQLHWYKMEPERISLPINMAGRRTSTSPFNLRG